MQNHFIKTLLLPFFLLLCACSLTKETAGEYIDDTTITSKIYYNIIKTIGSKAHGIHVETFQRVVQLSGFVTDYKVAMSAGRIATEVKGVKSVKNSIQVKVERVSKQTPSKSKNINSVLDDAKITVDIKQQLLREENTSSQAIHVATNNGEVTLSGRVRDFKEASTAEKIAKKTKGVTKVFNDLIM